MKNNRGFTLVELLVTIVILGVISGMSWPMIRRLQEQNTRSKYTTYGDALVSASKIYVDSYKEDLFFYDDDLETMPLAQKQLYQGSGELLLNDSDGSVVMQCGMIKLQDLLDHNLIRDIGIDYMSCNSDYTFVIVKKKKNNYEYNYYLGCGTKKDDKKIPDDRINIKIPEDIPSKELNGYCK